MTKKTFDLSPEILEIINKLSQLDDARDEAARKILGIVEPVVPVPYDVNTSFHFGKPH